MAGVFISYAREDRDTARALAEQLEANGYSVWWDRELVAGNQFADVIESKLDAADAVIVLWSQHSRKSYWVRDEAAVGRDRNRLIPFSLDDDTPPLGFRQLHTPSLAGWDGRSDEPVRLLWTSLAALTGQQPPRVSGAEAAAPARRIVAGVSAEPNNKPMADILKGEKRQRSFLNTFWATSFAISGVIAGLMAALSPWATSMQNDDGSQADPVISVIAGGIVGFLFAGFFLMLGRFAIVVGRRLSKRKSVRYFDQPTLICLGIATAIGLASTLSPTQQNTTIDSIFLTPAIVTLFFFCNGLISIPIGFFRGLGRKTFEDGK